MDFAFDEGQQAIEELTGQMFGRLASAEAIEAHERAGGWLHRDLWRELAKAEVLGAALPADHGGGGMGLIELCLLLRQQGRHVAPVPVLETLMTASLAVARFGSPALREALLRPVAAGEVILSLAWHDAHSRDPRRPETTAEAAGDGFVLRGERACVPFVDDAGFVLVLARAGEAIGGFLIDPAGAGVRIERQEGTHGEPLAHLILDGAEVPASHAMIDPQLAPFVARRASLGTCALKLGIAERALEMTAGHTREREQFGVPIGSFQAVAQRAADAYIDVAAMRLSLWQAAWQLQRHADDPSTERARQADRALAIAGFWSAEAGHRVAATAQHLHAGMGFDRDYPLHRYFLWSKHHELALGGARAPLAALGAALAE